MFPRLSNSLLHDMTSRCYFVLFFSAFGREVSVTNGTYQCVLHTGWWPGAYIRLMALIYLGGKLMSHHYFSPSFLMTVHVDQYSGYAGIL